jgi:hypothetical protein
MMASAKKRTKWFWNAGVGPWRCWGVWWKQRIFVGISVINQGQEWHE